MVDVDFEAIARAKSDDQLKAMLEGDPRDWQPEALEAARAELRSRGVAFDEAAADAKRRSKGEKLDATSILGMAAGAGLVLLGIAVLMVGTGTIRSFGTIVSGLCLLAYFATRRRGADD